jgi:hypothetical protein
MPNRREFLHSTLGVVGAGVARKTGRSQPAPSVEARSTIFYAHPNGEQTLVRFVVSDAEAPAGRMRVYDASHRLLGTAGVIGSGGRLYGELWMGLRGATRVTTELDLPGRSSPVRTQHTLEPRRRWTLYWVTIVNPDDLVQRLGQLSPVELGLQLAILRSTEAGGNPYPLTAVPSDTLDNIPFLRSAHGALELERRYGIPSSPIALTTADTLGLGSAPIAMNGAGVSYAILTDGDAQRPFEILPSRDGSRVVAVSPVPGGEAKTLGFGAGRDAMLQGVEEWLTTSPTLLSPAYFHDSAVVLSSTVDDNRAAMAQAVTEWNSRFAYPRIEIGRPDGFFGLIERLGSAPVRASSDSPARSAEDPHPFDVTDAASTRRNDADDRIRKMLQPLNDILGATAPGIAGLASGYSSPFPGALVFNPSPTSRTDRVMLPDASERMVTDVPPMGYVYVPLGGETRNQRPYLDPGDTAVGGQRHTVRVDPVTGAIQSVFDRIDGREWVAADGAWNDVDGARVERVQRFRLPGIGARLVVTRSLGGRRFETVITVYDDRGWVDLHNYSEGDAVTVGFDLELRGPTVSWETPAGWEECAAPTGTFAHLRWTQLKADDGWRILFRALDAPFVRVSLASPPGVAGGDHGEGHGDAPPRCRLVSFAPAGTSRYRFAFGDPFTSADEPWFFGWGAEPFVAATVRETGGTPLPSYGRLLRVSVGALALGLQPAEDADGVILYLQDIAGVTRDVGVEPGILQFDDARVVDLVERNVGDRLPVTSDGTMVPLRAFGVTAVRLRGLGLRSS